MKNKIIAILLLVGSISSQAATLEPLLGYTVGNNGVTFQVFSGGCTGKASFAVSEERHSSVRAIALYRMVPDYCLALFYYGTKVTFSFEELRIYRGESFRIVNPMQTIRRREF